MGEIPDSSVAEIHDNVLASMPAERARQIEDTLWWKLGRQEMLEDFFARARRERAIASVLEIGCGSGGDLEWLSRHGRVTGVDRSPTLVARARERGKGEVLEGDFFEVAPRGHYDIACLFDVLEHVEDHEAFVRRIADILEPGQLLLISVPAVPWLHGPHDELLLHFRRYTRAELDGLLEACGFEIVRGTHFVSLLFPAFAAARLASKLAARFGWKAKEARVGEMPHVLNTLLLWALRLDVAIARHVDLPIGAWYIALARRSARSAPRSLTAPTPTEPG